MAENHKNTQKEFQNFCEGMSFTDMMRKMTGAKKACGSFQCAEMMSEMMKMCSRAGGKEKGARPRSQEE